MESSLSLSSDEAPRLEDICICDRGDSSGDTSSLTLPEQFFACQSDEEIGEEYFYSEKSLLGLKGLEKQSHGIFRSRNAMRTGSSRSSNSFRFWWTIALCAFAVFCCASTNGLFSRRSFLQWNEPSRLASRRLTRKITKMTSKATQPNLFTVVLAGGRVDLLHQSVRHYASCETVGYIRVDWTDPKEAFPSRLLQHGKVVALDSEIGTDALLALDEDIQLSCLDLEHAFSEWQIDPLRAVGFIHDDSLLSDRAIMIHRLYWESKPSITIAPECQHLVLSAYCAAVSETSPIVLATQQEQSSSMSGCRSKFLEATNFEDVPKAARTRFVGRSMM